jgi:hypothetical protein
MAKNGKVGDGHRNGMVKGRSQVLNPITKQRHFKGLSCNQIV